jgi:ribosomal-protein-alanine N-acetyltransferase
MTVSNGFAISMTLNFIGLTVMSVAASTLNQSCETENDSMDSIPRLETERLKLRAIFPSDAADIFSLLSDPNVAKHHELAPFETMEQAHDMIANYTLWFQNDQAVRWGIVSKGNGDLIGTCCFDTFHQKYQSINLGYNLRSSCWGNGFATEAVAKIIEFAFANGIVGPVNRIQAITVPQNVASEKVLARLGFEKEGLMRQYGCWKGEFRDMHLFSLLKGETFRATDQS